VTPLRLRVDVCTYQGLRDGAPEILRILKRRNARATFFVAFGPDSSGRAVFNLLKPSFARKMFRTNAAGSYGLATALYGTVLPAPLIGSGRHSILRRLLDEGHELGVHGWDHRRWQDDLDEYSRAKLASEFDRMCEAFRAATGRAPQAFAAPAWRVSPALLELEARAGLAFASDSRGSVPFLPVFEGRRYSVPQVPVTFPTLDEALVLMSAAEFYRETLAAAQGSGDYACLAVHAEMEGRKYARDFERFLEKLERPVAPLGSTPLEKAAPAAMSMKPFAGRSYMVCVQEGGSSP
jgi:undecaprenyl phosphate-alpha-L-ara4FN deformylase